MSAPITLTTSAPTQSTTDGTAVVTITPAPAAGTVLKFSLTVVDDLNNTSPAATVTVTVQDLPVAVVTGPKAVAAKQTITLVGDASTPTGHITKYNWTLLPPTT